MQINKIYCEDILEFTSRFKDGSIDFIFSDPPYNKKKNYEVYKDNLPEDKYWEWVEKFISEYRRISNNQFSIFIGSELTRKYWNLMPDAKQIIIRKGAIGTPSNNYFRQYFSILVTKSPTQRIYDLWWNVKMPGEGYFFKEERFPNPGLTSLKLTQRVLNYFTRKGDLVADGFMGVGTTAVAAISLNRNFVGSEINPRYIEIADKRLIREYAQTKLALAV